MRKALSTAVICLSNLVLASSALATDFPSKPYEANFERHTVMGQTVMRMCTDGKGRVRIDSSMPGTDKQTKLIIDYPKKRSIMLLEDEKLALVSDIEGDTQSQGSMNDAKVKQYGGKALGARVINGYKCHGYDWTRNGSHCTQWTGDDIDCPVMSITQRDEDRESMQLVKYKAGVPSKENFVVPPGYKEQKMLKPGNLGGR